MKITKNQEGNRLTVSLDGRLDAVTIPKFDSELKGGLDGVDELIVDCSNLEYISSAGLRTLLSVQRILTAKNGSMKLTNVNEIVREVLDVTGLLTVLTIE
jgi:anti-sigma B factor antagonist